LESTLASVFSPPLLVRAFKQNGMLLQEKKRKEKKIGVALLFPPLPLAQ
jgi:hypothetical protein